MRKHKLAHAESHIKVNLKWLPAPSARPLSGWAFSWIQLLAFKSCIRGSQFCGANNPFLLCLVQISDPSYSLTLCFGVLCYIYKQGLWMIDGFWTSFELSKIGKENVIWAIFKNI